MEVAYYATTLLFLLCRSFSDFAGPTPDPKIQLLSSCVFIAAIAVALNRKRIWWRLPMFFAVFVAFGVNMADSSKVNGAHWRIDSARSDAEMADLAPFLQRQVDGNNDRYRRFQLATLYAYLGEDQKYVEQCELLLSDGNFYRRNVAEQTAKAFLLKPELHNDLTKVHQLARWASDQKAYNAWGYLVRALSECRQGHLQESLQWCMRCREVAEKQDEWQKSTVAATTFLIEALTYQQVGDAERSSVAQQKAIEVYAPHPEAAFEAKLTFSLLLTQWKENAQ